MSDTLNEKIKAIYEKVKCEWGDSPDDLANDIEKLILQEKIDLLNSIWVDGERSAVVVFDNYTPLEVKISELTNQLKALT